MEAIVLAGGFGTRLKSVVTNTPKPMARVNKKPFLEYILKYLEKNGVTRIILAVGYKWEIIKEYFGDSFNNIELIYSIENEPLGTGGAIKKALSFVKNDYVFIINGDTLFDIDLSELTLKDNSKMIIALKKMLNFDRYGCIEVDKNKYVVSFIEKKYNEIGYINGGIYLITKDIFENISIVNKFSFEEFMGDKFKDLKISTKIFEDYFIDIGIPDDYEKAQREIK